VPGSDVQLERTTTGTPKFRAISTARGCRTFAPNGRGSYSPGGLISQAVHRFQVNPQGQVKEVGKIPIGARVRDVRVGPDGLIYVLTDAPNGQLLRIEPAP